jgi:RNA polymerase sigma factor (TIGR02999 family)
MGGRGEVTELLLAMRGGDRRAFDALLPLVYDELRSVARRQLARHRPTATLDATGLVHDAYLKLADPARLDARDRGHFLGIAARAMRQVIVDRARRRNAERRGGAAVAVALEDAPEPAAPAPGDAEAAWLADLDAALERLGARSERLARVVECRFFAGLSEAETAAALGVSLRTAQREWQRARAWLQLELGVAPTPAEARR